MTLRRIAVIALSMAVLCASIPSPALALSTGSEIQIGKQYDKQITDTSVIVTDPLLNAWVADVTNRLWAQTARKDVPYSIKIIDESDPNAFSTLGGYIYVNEGILDFVQSDDELAGVLGHETGHIERRHTVTANNKASIMNVLFGIGSLFSPFLYRFGQLLYAGAMAKVSRDDETQADQYGLMLMTRAGYDPEAMLTFMQHFNAVYRENRDVLEKYLADHPDWPYRMSKIQGYPELDPTKRTDEQRLAAAVHDLDTARYNVAAIELNDLTRKHPDNATAQFDLGQAELALGQVTKGEQNIAASAERISPQAKAVADVRIKSLRDAERRLDLMHPDLQPLRTQLATEQNDDAQADIAIATRRKQGLDQLKALNSRIQNIVYGMPDFSRVQPRPNSRLETLLHNVNTMSKSMSTALSKGGDTIAGIGSVERGKEGGLLKENADILAELSAPLKLQQPGPQILATLPAYPHMFASLAAADADMVRGLDAARGALALLDSGAGDLDAFINELRRSQLDATGDVAVGDYRRLEPLVTKAVDSLNKAAVAGTQASQLFNMARSRQLETRIDMLGLSASSDRYATFQRALELRFKNRGLDYASLVHDGWTPGQVASAVIVGADTNAAPEAILAESKASGKSIVDLANARGMFAQSLEIFLGLVYLDYTDDPSKEAHAGASPAGSTGPA